MPSHDLSYDCAADPDRLERSATLRRDGVVLFTRGVEVHWWLTGFRWGVLSDPGQLSMDVAITLKDGAMRDAFLAGIAGRPYPDLEVTGTTVSFTFDQTFAVPQPPLPPPVRAAVEAANRTVVDSYTSLGCSSNDPNHVDAEFLGVAGLGILRLTDHSGLIATQRAIEIGTSPSSVVPALADGFSIAASTAEGWLNGVSQAFSTWVSEIQGTAS